MNRFIFTLVLSTFSLATNAQCLCADIKFDIQLKGMNLQDRVPKYSIVLLKSNHYHNPSQKNFFYKKNEGKNIYAFSFKTLGGIDTLQFNLVNHSTAKTMSITIAHLTYDIPYYINLIKFKPGNYFFDFRNFEGSRMKNREKGIHLKDFKKIVN